MNTADPFDVRYTSDTFVSFLKSGTKVAMRASGVSMFPYLFPSDKLIVRPLGKGEKLSKGAIVVMRVNRKLVVHRLIDDGHGGLTSCGDSHTSPDAFFHESELVGVVEAYVRCGLRLRTNGLCALVWCSYLFSMAPLSYRCNNLLASLLLKMKCRKS